jgi:hypothetical protein
MRLSERHSYNVAQLGKVPWATPLPAAIVRLGRAGVNGAREGPRSWRWLRRNWRPLSSPAVMQLPCEPLCVPRDMLP